MVLVNESKLENTYIINENYTLSEIVSLEFDIKSYKYNSDNITGASLTLGGKNKRCIEIVINTSQNTGIIDRIAYDSKCVNFGNMSNGQGTHKLIITAISIIRNKYNWVKFLHIIDTSKKYCKNSKGFVRLLPFNIAFYGSSWYQRYYGAYLKNTERIEIFNNYLDRLKSDIFKKDNEQLILTYLPNTQLNTLFLASINLQSFFMEIKKLYEIEELCDLCSNWLNRFIEEFIFDNNMNDFTNWIIDIDKLPLIEIKTELIKYNFDWSFAPVNGPNMSGGKFSQILNNKWECFLGSTGRSHLIQMDYYSIVDYD
jgi:hypothetical protein